MDQSNTTPSDDEDTNQPPAHRKKRSRPQESLTPSEFPSQPFPAEQQPPTPRHLRKTQLSPTSMTLDRLGIPREHPPKNLKIPRTGPPGFPLAGAHIPPDFKSDEVQLAPNAALPYQRAARLSHRSAMRAALHRSMEQILIGDRMPLWSLGLDILPGGFFKTDTPEHRLTSTSSYNRDVSLSCCCRPSSKMKNCQHVNNSTKKGMP